MADLVVGGSGGAALLEVPDLVGGPMSGAYDALRRDYDRILGQQQQVGHPSVPDRYERPCPTCQGTGINPVVKMLVCPKCNGEGRLRR